LNYEGNCALIAKPVQIGTEKLKPI